LFLKSPFSLAAFAFRQKGQARPVSSQDLFFFFSCSISTTAFEELWPESSVVSLPVDRILRRPRVPNVFGVNCTLKPSSACKGGQEQELSPLLDPLLDPAAWVPLGSSGVFDVPELSGSTNSPTLSAEVLIDLQTVASGFNDHRLGLDFGSTGDLCQDAFFNTFLCDADYHEYLSVPTVVASTSSPASEAAMEPSPSLSTSLTTVESAVAPTPFPIRTRGTKRTAPSTAIAEVEETRAALQPELERLPKEERRRICNNLSAVKSRAKRRELEQQNQDRVADLERENTELRARLAHLEKETSYLREILLRMASKDA